MARPPAERPTGYTIAVSYLPLAYCALGVAVAWAQPGPWSAAIAALAWIYVLPPALARIAFALCGRPEGRGLRQSDRAYKVWWFAFNLQAVHNRFPWFDEALRLVPGLYAAWLNAWGSRVSPLVYWSPGSRVVDRSLAAVGPYAVIGVDAGMVGHLARVEEDGSYRLDVGVSEVGPGAVLGGKSGLGPGSRLWPDEMLPVGRLLAPHVHWRDGRKRVEAETQP